jgi:glutathione S-transferase
MKLHYHPVSMTSRPLMFFIEDNGLDVEMNVIDLMTGEHYKPPFSQMNPCCQVPVLEDDGFVLSESSAILKYLADKFGLASLYPTDLQARARVNEVMDWFNTQFYREYGYNLVYPQIFAHHERPAGTQEGTLAWGRERAERWLGILDQNILGKRAFVAGDSITIADYLASGLVTAGEHIRIDFDKFPNVKRWLGAMKSRPAWKKTHDVHEGFKASLADKEFVTI